MKRYFQAPISTGPAKSGGPAAAKTITKEEPKADMDEVIVTPLSRRQKKGKNERLKRKEGETTQEGKDRRAENKQNRREARREKIAGKLEKAKAAGDKPIKTAKLEKRKKRQEDRDKKRSKRKEGKAERKNIRKKAKEGKIIEGKSGEYNALSKREKIKKSRKKQRE